MPIDINHFRKEKGGDPEVVRESQRKRFADETVVDKIIAADAQLRQAKFDHEAFKKQKNDIGREVAAKKKASKGQDKCEELCAQSKEFDAKITEKLEEKDAIELDLEKMLKSIGNIVGPNVIVSKTEDDNETVRTWGEPNRDIKPVDGEWNLGHLHHHEIMECIDMVETERGQKVAGHRGYYLKGPGVLLNQALINFGITTLMQSPKKYVPIQPPYFMKKEIMEATCQLDDFEENLYKVIKKDKDGEDCYYLTATSEQPISAMHMKEWLAPAELPKHYAGVSTCFRKEAGSHGRDVWGIFRVHQFEKVEQFIYCEPQTSWEEFEGIIKTSESFYQALELPYRVQNIVSKELNDAAAAKFDLEAWFPGYNDFRELVSCSNCTDYQSRALDTRYNLQSSDEKLYVHMLNGTMCATERTMCCILENNQTETGVKIPKCLQQYMGGMEFIPYNEKCVAAFQERKQREKEDEEKKAAKKGGAKGGKAKAPAVKKEAKPAPQQEEQKQQKNEWPELVGKTGEEAMAAITAERPELKVECMEEGGMMTMDFRTDRVRVMCNAQGQVASPPRCG